MKKSSFSLERKVSYLYEKQKLFEVWYFLSTLANIDSLFFKQKL